MATFTVTYTSTEVLEVEADSAEDAIEIAKNTDQGRWALADNDWDAYCSPADAVDED